MSGDDWDKRVGMAGLDMQTSSLGVGKGRMGVGGARKIRYVVSEPPTQLKHLFENLFSLWVNIDASGVNPARRKTGAEWGFFVALYAQARRKKKSPRVVIFFIFSAALYIQLQRKKKKKNPPQTARVRLGKKKIFNITKPT